MLVNGAVACSNQAYEVFLFMNERGIYQVPRMNDQTAKTFLHSYQQAAEQQQAGMQQQFDLY
jgi:spore coat protein CotF